MAQVYGQIESLKQIRKKLDAKGIDEFNSLRELDAFLDNYESDIKAIYQHYEKELDIDILLLEDGIKFNSAFVEERKSESHGELEEKINKHLNNADKNRRVESKSHVGKTLTWLFNKYVKTKIKTITIAHNHSLKEKIRKIARQLEKDKKLLSKYTTNRDIEIELRCNEKVERLIFIKDAIEELKPLIAGAIGENLVENEIKKLSDEYILINDFSLSFNPPIYNRKENDRIFSIQVDHLLISRAGLFILETKNWSKKSILSFDMRSPIEQVSRTGYALFVLLNSKNDESEIKLSRHHWGRKRIPIRSIVVMINEKPDVDFMHIKVKTLNELNGYIRYFKPVFNDEEFEYISKIIIDLYNRNNKLD